jgi:ankyrin repeat protein
MALEKGHPGLVQLLLKHGADPNARGVDGQTLLHVSSRKGDWKVARELLNLDVDINSRDNQGRTPLQVALERQEKSCATIVGARCRKYVTPAWCGCRNAGTSPSFERSRFSI